MTASMYRKIGDQGSPRCSSAVRAASGIPCRHQIAHRVSTNERFAIEDVLHIGGYLQQTVFWIHLSQVLDL